MVKLVEKEVFDKDKAGTVEAVRTVLLKNIDKECNIIVAKAKGTYAPRTKKGKNGETKELKDRSIIKPTKNGQSGITLSYYSVYIQSFEFESNDFLQELTDIKKYIASGSIDKQIKEMLGSDAYKDRKKQLSNKKK